VLFKLFFKITFETPGIFHISKVTHHKSQFVEFDRFESQKFQEISKFALLFELKLAVLITTQLFDGNTIFPQYPAQVVSL
jgi:hypothetical protein